MSPAPVFVRIPGSHHPGIRLRLIPGFRDPGSVLILGQVTQYGNPYLICITCAFHIPCTHTPESIDMHRGMCDNCTYCPPCFESPPTICCITPCSLSLSTVLYYCPPCFVLLPTMYVLYHRYTLNKCPLMCCTIAVRRVLAHHALYYSKHV